MRIFLLVIIILILVYLISTYLMFILVSRKLNNDILPMTKAVYKAVEPYLDIIKIGNDWMNNKYKNKEIKDVFIKSFDNLKLHGILLENKKSKGIIIEAHGYRSTAQSDLYTSVFEYYNMGYSLLLIDNRCCNMSEGKYITFGIKESDDIISWIKYINKKYPKQDIILAGISMGATSILMSLGSIKKSMRVKKIMVDSGYISPYDEVVYCINHYFHIPGKLFVNMIDIWCRVFGKFSLKDKDTITSISNSKIPILFIHGLDDDFVLPINSKLNYEKYDGDKELVLFKGASHGLSYLVDSKKYIKIIKKHLLK